MQRAGGVSDRIEDARVKARHGKPKKTAAVPVVYNFRRLKGSGVLFVLLWSLLVFSYQQSAMGNLVDLLLTTGSHEKAEPWVSTFAAGMLSDCLTKMLYPLVGWLADAKLGRYRVMRYSLWIMWVGSVLIMLTSIARYVFMFVVEPGEKDAIIKYTLPLYAVIYVINTVGMAGFHVNVIPFSIDQMEGGASGESIAALVHWYYWTRNFNFGIIVQFAVQYIFSYCTDDIEYRRRLDLYVLLIQMIFLTAAVCLDFTFSSKFLKDPKIHNPVKKVKDISAFILKHDQLVGQRKAHTFSYEAPPTRSDFAKQSYGGPYEDDEVEEVTSFWRIVVILLLAGFGAFLIQTGYYNYPSFYEHMGLGEADCATEYLVTTCVPILTFIFCIPIFEFLIYPYFRNYIPRTTVRIGLGLFVVMLGLGIMLTLDAVGHSRLSADASVCMFYNNKKTSGIPINSLYIIVVIVVMAIGEMLVNIAMLEFVCAQSPYSMRGLIIGILFLIYGLSVGFVSMPVLVAFSLGMKNHHTGVPSCGTWYITAVLVMGCLGTALYLVAAKRYKKRQRGGQRDINPQTVLEGYYERSVKNKRPMDFYYQNHVGDESFKT